MDELRIGVSVSKVTIRASARRCGYGMPARGRDVRTIMADISRFFGLVVRMHFRDHPPPHIHVRYGRADAQIGIAPVELIGGRLPPRLLALAIHWGKVHQAELLRNWDGLQSDQPPRRIAPLE